MIRSPLVPVACAAALLTAVPASAWACGGFFCNQQIPIDQSGEQIVFSLDENGVTAHILIQFQGNARDFAWVIPVMAKPKLKLGTQALFMNLLQRTQPQFTMDPGSVGQCSGGFRGVAGSNQSAPGAAEDSVKVVERREVGPYDTVTLESTDAGKLVEWLKASGYDQPESSTPLIEHYVKAGMLFVALKLKQDAGTGEIQPIVLEIPHSEACVPLILTRVAAVPDMPVQAFVLGKHRAFPRNWFHVELNLKRIDWPGFGQNYRQVVTDAVNEAAGHGFVTEFAGPSAPFKGMLWSEGRFNLEALRPLTDPTQLRNALARQGFIFDQTLQALLQKHAPPGSRVDTAAFIAELEERVIKPLRDAQEMIDRQPYLTRLYSTVSPDEMTRDPLFHFNPELPNVSNLHRARAVGGTCQPDGTIANLVLLLENGERLYYDAPVASGRSPRLARGVPLNAGPAAARIELVGTSGMPTTYTAAQARQVDKALDQESPEAVRLRPVPGMAEGFFGCTVGAVAPTSAALGLALAAFVAALRRRRR